MKNGMHVTQQSKPTTINTLTPIFVHRKRKPYIPRSFVPIVLCRNGVQMAKKEENKLKKKIRTHNPSHPQPPPVRLVENCVFVQWCILLSGLSILHIIIWNQWFGRVLKTRSLRFVNLIYLPLVTIVASLWATTFVWSLSRQCWALTTWQPSILVDGARRNPSNRLKMALPCFCEVQEAVPFSAFIAICWTLFNWYIKRM